MDDPLNEALDSARQTMSSTLLVLRDPVRVASADDRDTTSDGNAL